MTSLNFQDVLLSSLSIEDQNRIKDNFIVPSDRIIYINRYGQPYEFFAGVGKFVCTCKNTLSSYNNKN